MKVKDIMTTDVRKCFTSDSLATAAHLMWDHDCGCVPVLNEQARVVGMLTDRDICRAAFFQGARRMNKDGRLVGLLSLSDIARDADQEYTRESPTVT